MKRIIDYNSCGNCIYWEIGKRSKIKGDCKRYPPFIRITLSESDLYVNPTTYIFDTCGELKPIPNNKRCK